MSQNDPSEDERFDPQEFIKRHLKVTAWVNERSQVYTKKELTELVNTVITIFKKEPTLATLSPPCVIVGDIHGQYRDLVRILDCSNGKCRDGRFRFPLSRFMFLGDYVDRGPHSVECICLVFTLKILYPDQYMILRGNHETKAINYAYGFREELINKLGRTEGVEVWEKFNEAFSWMPLAGLVGTKILCMHGGISPHLSSLDDIRKIDRPLPEINVHKLAQDLLWADPLDILCVSSMSTEPQYLKNTLRGLSVTFNEAAVIDTCNRLNIEMVVRAHQVMDNGFRFYANKKLVTIFSAPKYMNENNNLGAVLRVEKNGAVGITTMKAKEKRPPNTPEKQHELTRGDDEPESSGRNKHQKSQQSQSTQSMSISSTTSQTNARSSKKDPLPAKATPPVVDKK